MKNRIALVTGAGRGIGRAIALSFAREGSRVALVARSHQQLEEVSQLIDEQTDGQSMILVNDLSDRQTPSRIVGQVLDQWGPIEVLVNNAGVGSSQDPKPLVEFDDDFWDLTFAVNVTAPYLLTKLVLPDMLAAGWGRIINIASINSKMAAMHGAAYAASKHAIGGLTRATATDYPSSGVTCNAICPGVTATELNDLRIEYDAQRTSSSFEDLVAKASPLGRRIEPDEIAPLAVFLASDGARAINGQLINVCGGKIMF